MPPIRVLPESVANQIAAGEVVERPASAVKELVENALDAGARRVQIEIGRGGLELIRVSDDGSGIPASEAPLALARHGTSKLSGADDLWSIRTLGFRGEALPSIAAVSRLELVTRAAPAVEATVIEADGSALSPPRSTGAARGTTVTVRDLFFNTPARLKFLKSEASEAAQVTAAVTGLALAHPEVAFTMSSEGRQLINTPGRGGMLAAVAAILGARVAKEMIPVRHTSPFVTISGLIGTPAAARANRAQEFFFLNGRVVQNRVLSVAVEKAYGSLLPARRFPLALLCLQVAPEEVDVNVHPTKREVRFRHESEVYQAIFTSVRTALGQMPAVGASTVAPPSPQETWAEASFLPLSYSPGEAVQTPAATAHEAAPDAASAPLATAGIRYIGQLARTYLLIEQDQRMVLVDQHAAHERVIFDRLRGQRGAGRLVVQPLLVPETLEIPPAEEQLLRDQLSSLRELGLELEEFGHRSFIIRAVPAMLARGNPAEALVEALAEVAASGGASKATTSDSLLAAIACKAAIKAGEALAQVEAEALLSEWLGTEAPWTCPHGRPVSLSYDVGEIGRRFLRGGVR